MTRIRTTRPRNNPLASAHNIPKSWTGLLLAGGESKRMGQCKAQLRVADSSAQTFLQHGWSLLRRVCGTQFLLGQVPELAPNLQWSDHSPLAGPLKALANALPKIETEWVLLIPVDMPGLHQNALQEFQQFANDHESIALALPEKGQLGFPVAIPRREFGAIIRASEKGASSLFSVLNTLGCAIWTAEHHAPLVLENINTPQQLGEWHSAQESS
ncbi:MAG: NTP transferase domain-containing protein [Planctomycetota bacterium]|nr:NTP transferase domain-containing protein [Planctomycetota bacterium]MDA1112896.1 NTP transferase domain-containing protein [Planctomycetota bacterium]